MISTGGAWCCRLWQSPRRPGFGFALVDEALKSMPPTPRYSTDFDILGIGAFVRGLHDVASVLIYERQSFFFFFLLTAIVLCAGIAPCF